MVTSSQLGKILRTVYPNLTTRRFGRRGESRYHYVGIEWNKAIIDDDLACQIENHIQSQIKVIKEVPEPSPKPKSEFEPKTNEVSEFSELSPDKNSTYSYVHGSSKYPQENCLPRNGQFTPGTVPQQSQWARKTMKRSIIALKELNVDTESFTQNFNVLIFSSINICTEFQRLMVELGQRSVPHKAYLHLYLVVLLLAFPLCIASEKEVSGERQVILRENLKNFTGHLQTYSGKIGVGNLNHFLNFTNLMKKLMHLSQLISSNFKTTLVKETIKEFYHDLSQTPTMPQESLGISTAIDEMIFKNVFVALKAVYFDYDGEALGEKISLKDETITEIAKQLAKCSNFVIDSVIKIPENMSDEDRGREFYDLIFQVFKIQLLVLNNFWLPEPLISELNIHAINFIVSNFLKDMQCISFGGLGRREHEVSKETFKLWWVCSAVFQEYISILSEVVGLTDMLSA